MTFTDPCISYLAAAENLGCKKPPKMSANNSDSEGSVTGWTVVNDRGEAEVSTYTQCSK